MRNTCGVLQGGSVPEQTVIRIKFQFDITPQLKLSEQHGTKYQQFAALHSDIAICA